MKYNNIDTMEYTRVVMQSEEDLFNEYYLKYIRILAAENGMTQEEINTKYNSRYNIELYDPLYVKAVKDFRDIIDPILSRDTDPYETWTQDEQIIYNRMIPFLDDIERIIDGANLYCKELCYITLVPTMAKNYCYAKINKKDNLHYIKYDINKFIKDFHAKGDTTLEEYEEFTEVLRLMVDI